MFMVSVEHMKARRTELNTGLEALRAELTKIDETRNTTVSQIQQLLGAIQILNELIEPVANEATDTETSEPVES
jgi:uncharacterized coiled-coil DUF342 family protein